MVPSAACFEPTRYADQQQQEALEEVHRQFWLSEESLHGVIDYFQKELKAGLLDDRSSDLNMIPSFVSGNSFFVHERLYEWVCVCLCICVYVYACVYVWVYGLVLYVNGCTKGNLREINQDILLGKRKGPIWHLKSYPWTSTFVRSY